MLARRLSVEEIERLLRRPLGPAPIPKSPPVNRHSEAARALASAVESMVGAEKDTDEIAAFLDAFLRRQGAPQERSQVPYQELQSTGPAFRDSEEFKPSARRLSSLVRHENHNSR
jgi:hypothetical protein